MMFACFTIVAPVFDSLSIKAQ